MIKEYFINCCYHSKIDVFLKVSLKQWLKTMIDNFKLIFEDENPKQEQINAWEDCFEQLQRELKKLDPINIKDYEIIFEYILPMEGGRRPDVILLLGNKIIILEFKMKDRYGRSDLDQLKGYYRDIYGYHKESQGKLIIPFLITTRAVNKYKLIEKIYHICSCDMLVSTLKNNLDTNIQIDGKKWLSSEYSPLPTLISAAKEIFNKKDLQELKTAKSAGVYSALEKLKLLVKWIENKEENILILVTGVPGAGKTLLGLEFVHHTDTGMFLSGNGPLVEVLQYVLGSKTFVKALKNIKWDYKKNKKIPSTNIIVFDEAQRAWDHSKDKSRIPKSEPQYIIEMADNTPKGCVYLGLVGEGQEIHVGEEKGIVLWKKALLNSNKKWMVVCPEKIGSYFDDIKNLKVKTDEVFNLDVSLRSHLATSFPQWVSRLLDNNPDLDLAKKIQADGFVMYITRDLEKAKRYCKNRYDKIVNKKYGKITSSRGALFNSLKRKSKNSIKIGPWFAENKDSSYSCCSFNHLVTEFECQGLEIDFPILCWEDDMIYKNEDWIEYKGTGNFSDKDLDDPHRVRTNSYRVLLTRGRDGIIIYLPKVEILDETYNYFLKAGMVEL